MSDKDLRRAPHKPASNGTLRQDVWWYEEPSGIAIYRSPGNGLSGDRVALIQWRVLRDALARKDRA